MINDQPSTQSTNQTNDNISIYYPVGNGINPGAIITFYDKTYLILNQESLENRVYHRSDGLNADVMISTYNKQTGEEVAVPAFAYDLTGSLVKNGNIMTITAGDTEFMTGDNPISRKLTINSEFEALGCFYKIVNCNYKTGICRIQATITQRHEEIEYGLKIKANQTYTQGEAVKMIAEPTIDGGPVANPTLIWSSSNPEIVSIDEDGNALFVGIGTCAISCLWKEHNITDTIYVEVVDIPTSLKCEIDGSDDMYTSTETSYTAIFYVADGVTVDGTVSPVWTLDLPKELTGCVKIVKQSGNTITLKASGGYGKSFGLVLAGNDERYSATKTITIRSWL